MAQVYKKIITAQEIQQILDYFAIDDDRWDHRPVVSSKHPRWDIDPWPQEIVKRVIDQIVPYPWAADETVIIDQRGYEQRVHVDSHREWLPDRLGPAVLIPLEFTPCASTVFFDNYWMGTTVKFSKTPSDVVIKHYERLGLSAPLQTDYHDVVNINDSEFDEEFRKKYLHFLTPKDLHGLTVQKVVDWELGDAMAWNRTQLHCGSGQHTRKKYIIIFTHRLNNS